MPKRLAAVVILSLVTSVTSFMSVLADEGLRLEKRDGAVVIAADAADMDVIPLGSDRWALVLAVGDPPRVRILYLHLELKPGPPAPPQPDLPEATRLAREWLSLVPQKARARAPFLAAAFNGVADAIEGGQLTDLPAIIAASTAANREAVGEFRNDWLAWFEQLRVYLNGLAEAGKLTLPADHARLFREIAKGLKE